MVSMFRTVLNTYTVRYTCKDLFLFTSLWDSTVRCMSVLIKVYSIRILISYSIVRLVRLRGEGRSGSRTKRCLDMSEEVQL
ncbi:hypothetical protein K523DRAFT_114244 [Schizophyllum commune Tattone D]|nr:hypothetical protein K523DRAFT_114244 [Schizophyllum commune Tattone D]